MGNQLEWRPVEAPRLDTRDLAVAGQVFDNSMGRFADLLSARDARLNKEATDKAAAQMMAAGSQDELKTLLAQGAQGGFGERVNLRDVMGVGNQRQEQLLQNSVRQQQMDIGREDLLTKQAFASTGAAGAQFHDLMGQGRIGEAKAVMAQMQQDNPDAANRVLYQYGKDGGDAFDKYRSAAEAERLHRAGEADAAAGREIQRGQLAISEADADHRRKQEGYAPQGYQVATAYADKFRTSGADVAAANMQEDPAFKALPPQVQVAALSNLAGIHARMNTLTPEVRAATNSVRGEVEAANSRIDSELNRRLNATHTEFSNALDYANDPKNNPTNEAVAQEAHKGDSHLTINGTRDAVDRARADVEAYFAKANPASPVKQVPNAVIMAATRLTRNTAGSWNSGLNATTGYQDWYREQLAYNIRKLMEEDAQGNNANLVKQRADLQASADGQKASNTARLTQAYAEARKLQAAGGTLTATEYSAKDPANSVAALAANTTVAPTSPTKYDPNGKLPAPVAKKTADLEEPLTPSESGRLSSDEAKELAAYQRDWSSYSSGKGKRLSDTSLARMNKLLTQAGR